MHNCLHTPCTRDCLLEQGIEMSCIFPRKTTRADGRNLQRYRLLLNRFKHFKHTDVRRWFGCFERGGLLHWGEVFMQWLGDQLARDDV